MTVTHDVEREDVMAYSRRRACARARGCRGGASGGMCGVSCVCDGSARCVERSRGVERRGRTESLGGAGRRSGCR